MVKIILRGRLVPNIGVSLDPFFMQRIDLPNVGINFDIETRILRDEVTSTCILNRFDFDENSFQVFSICRDNVENTVNMLVFMTGRYTQLNFENMELPDGTTRNMRLLFNFHEKHTTFLDNTPESMIRFNQIIHADRKRSKALQDLVMSLKNPSNTIIDCARSIETMRQCVCPGENRKEAWSEFRSKLNLSEEFIRFVVGQSAKPRHGGWDFEKDADVYEFIRRSWVCFDRMMHFFNYEGGAPLPENEFPIL